jgi:hypothetical protein
LRKVAAVFPTLGDDRADRAKVLLLDEVAWSHGGAIRWEGRKPGLDADWLFLDDEKLDKFIKYLWLEFPGVALEISDPL